MVFLKSKEANTLVTVRVADELQVLEEKIEAFTDKEITHLDVEEVHIFVRFLRELENMRDARLFSVK